MIIAESDKLFSRFSRLPHSRAALALVHAIFDSQTREHVVPFGSSNIPATLDSEPTYFEKLLKVDGVSKAWTDYTDVKDANKFPQKLAQGKAYLNGFRHYTLQDAIYLEYYIRVRLQAIAAPESKASVAELLTFADEIRSGLKYSADVRTTCEAQLGIPPHAVDDEWNNHKSQELCNSVGFYENVIEGKADSEYKKAIIPWLDIHFTLLPCIKGYYEIAKNIQNPLQNTLYYGLWIAGNQDPTFVDDYERFINANTGSAGQDDWNHWGRLFLQACKNEQAFFNLALSNYDKYDIVREGNVIPIRPHDSTTEYLTPDANNGVTLRDQEVKWELTNAKNGYTIKINVESSKYEFLKADVATHQVSTVDDGSQATAWDITFTTADQTYQLFVAGSEQWALNVDKSTKTVNVAENTSTGTVVQAQTNWVFKKA